jgi:hypothetical protein
MQPTATDYRIRISNIRFSTSRAVGSSRAVIRGFLQPHLAGSLHHFALNADYDGEKRLWGIDLSSLQWTSPVPRSLFDPRNVGNICKAVLEGFRLLWFQPIPGPNEGAGPLRVGHALMSEKQGHDAFSIVRSDILSLYHLDWPQLWPAIENRLLHDPEFWVGGFTREDASNAAATLKSIFPWEWVRRRYRNATENPSAVGMWDVMQADQGFPAYHLARTAIGCICKDPGWNFLITLAESCKLLKHYPKGDSLLRRIATEPGHIHQANFSGYLLKRHLLSEIEPPTGSGNAKHDMTARVVDASIDIEMKALTSSEPARQATKEIAEKCRKLPSVPLRPIVFFILLVEASVVSDPETWPDRLNSITQDVFGCTAGVSGVVIGRMFVDSVGGPVKWSFDKFILNQHAHHPVAEELLRKVFEPNWQRLAYPLLPIVFSYNLRDEIDGKASK